MCSVSVAMADDTGSATPSTAASPTPSASPKVIQSADDLLTNNNLRAFSGSLSKWSIASQVEYLGGTLGSPFSQDRPDISNGSGTTAKSDIDGSISVKYNIDVRNSLMLGFGFRWIAPFTFGSVNNYDGDRFDAMNPYLQYQYIYNWLGIQSVLQVQGTQWTQTDFTALGYARALNVDQENVYEIGKTGLSIGMSAWFTYQWFNKTGSYGSPSNPATYIANVQTVQSQYSFAFAPYLEYQVSDKVNLRTLINCAMYEHYQAISDKLSVVHDTVYQSIGVGISVTRDVFLYPNVQFLPGDFVSNETNVGLSATINLF